MTGQLAVGDGCGVTTGCPGPSVGYWVGPGFGGVRVGTGPGLQVGAGSGLRTAGAERGCC